AKSTVATLRSSEASSTRSTGAAQLGQKRASGGSSAPHCVQAATAEIVSRKRRTCNAGAEALPAARDAGLGVGRLLRTAARERRDEGALGRRERAVGELGDVEVAVQRLAATEPERVELATLNLLGDGVAGKEANAEAFAD